MEQMQFKISSALKDLVGKDLIINDNVAIFELVKNAYDAYAKKVLIEFYDDKIIIADNGKGMSLNDIKNKWLFLGYSAKKDGTEDKDSDGKQKSYRDNIRRHYAGAKGIGRFSCDRLGKELVLKTKSFSSNVLEVIKVNWTDFEINQSLEFAQINVEHNTLTVFDTVFPDNKPNGTILEISKLNDEKMPWTRKRLLDLKHSLEKLINPFAETNDFSIEIVCKKEAAEDKRYVDIGKHERELVNGVLKNSITSILDLKTTQIDVKLTKDSILTILSDRGVNMYEIREKNLSYDKLEDVRINLYYLNRSAKNNFTRLMGIEPVNYGSIFMFRNGFRIMPFGKTGDDSWGLDYRAQQGHSRYLGTRDLFGRVDVITDQVDELKEVSSRDGGLIETKTSQQLFELFEIAHRRLERYVMGVLWGGLFLQKDYFTSDEVAIAKRKELQDNDKDNDTPDYLLKSSLGSKIDFIQLIKSLARDKNIEIISYNKELANILSDQSEIENIKPQFINDLEKIAESTNDDNMLFSIDEAKKHIRELQKEKAAAEQRAIEADKKREKAERNAQEEIKKRIEAERKKEEEAEAKRIAQLQAKEAELKRREEEILRREAEQRRLEEEKKRKEVENAKKIVESELEKEKKQGIFQRSIIGREKEQILGLQHQINHSSGRVRNNIKRLLQHIGNNNINIDSKMQKYISVISLESAKIESLSNFVTNANFDLKASEITQNIIQFIEEYINEIYLPDTPVLSTMVTIKVKANIKEYILSFRPLEITTLIDNFVHNAEKAGAKNIEFIIDEFDKKLSINIVNDGKGIPVQNISRIFELGFTTTDGSGIGLYNVKTIVERLKGSISVESFIENKVVFRIVI